MSFFDSHASTQNEGGWNKLHALAGTAFVYDVKYLPTIGQVLKSGGVHEEHAVRVPTTAVIDAGTTSTFKMAGTCRRTDNNTQREMHELKAAPGEEWVIGRNMCTIENHVFKCLYIRTFPLSLL